MLISMTENLLFISLDNVYVKKTSMKEFIIIPILIISFYVQAQPSSSTIGRLKDAIVRVQSGNNIGTGFLWGNNKWVVTTLHLIDDHLKIEITLANDVKNAKVIKVLKEHDLVLLELESASSQLTIISKINNDPGLNSSLYTMGYNGRGNLNTI